MDVETDHLVTTLKAYPDLHAVLVGAHYTHALVVRGLLEASLRAVLELSRYEPIGEVEALVERFGAERFVYGSWYPGTPWGRSCSTCTTRAWARMNSRGSAPETSSGCSTHGGVMIDGTR